MIISDKNKQKMYSVHCKNVFIDTKKFQIEYIKYMKSFFYFQFRTSAI